MTDVIKFDKMPCIYWSDITKASYLQRRIIVHSILYYQMDESVISDKAFDGISKQLIRLRKQMCDTEYCKTEYYYCFSDFDGNTGFYLFDALNEHDKQYLTNIAQYVLKRYKTYGCGGKGKSDKNESE